MKELRHMMNPLDFSVEELDSGGAAVTSLIKNGALIRIEGGL